MLVVVGIVTLLMLLSLAAVHNFRDRAKKQYCQNNLREIGAALNHYEYLWKGILLPTTGPDDDNLRPLYPDCVNQLKIFVCISTANQVDTPEMLEDNAVGGRISGPGHSYEYLSYYLFDGKGDRLAEPKIKTRGSVDIRGDKVWLVMDAMESGYPEVPDGTDNHRDSGGNVLFADSHAEWIEFNMWRYAFRNGNSR